MSQLRQRDVTSRNSLSRDKRDDDVGDDDDDDDTAEFLQSNLRAHDYRKHQLNRLAFALCCVICFRCITDRVSNRQRHSVCLSVRLFPLYFFGTDSP